MSSNPVAGPETGPAILLVWRRIESRLLVNIGVVMFLLATGIMLIEAFSRSFLDHSFFWAEEAVRYLFVWAFFLNIGAAGVAGYHIRTGMLVDTLPVRWRRVANAVVSLCGIGFGVILFVASLPHLKRFYTMGMMTESNLDLPLWLLFSVVPVGAVLLGIFYLGALWTTLRGGDPFEVDNTHVTTDGGAV